MEKEFCSHKGTEEDPCECNLEKEFAFHNKLLKGGLKEKWNKNK